MAESALDVCNLAISRVGGEPIEAIGEDTPLGVFCQINYTHLRKWLLSKYRWVFANRTVQLTAVVDPGTGPGAKAFVKPADLIGVVHAYRDQADPRGARMVSVVESDGLYWANSATVWAEYTAMKPEASWPDWFTELVVVAFASQVAGHLSNRSLSADLYRAAFGVASDDGEGGLYSQARNEDGRGAPTRQLFAWDSGELVNARSMGFDPFGYGGYSIALPEA